MQLACWRCYCFASSKVATYFRESYLKKNDKFGTLALLNDVIKAMKETAQ